MATLLASDPIHIPTDLYIDTSFRYVPKFSYFGRTYARLEDRYGNSYQFEGRLSYTGSGNAKRIDWNRSTITGFEDSVTGIELTGMNLSGKTAYRLNTQDPSGGSLARYALRGNDIITGSSWGDDALNGYDGDDLINASFDSELTGGAGADLFQLDSSGEYVITDFNPAEGDRIEVLATGFPERLQYARVESLGNGTTRVSLPDAIYDGTPAFYDFAVIIPDGTFDLAAFSVVSRDLWPTTTSEYEQYEKDFAAWAAGDI